jgi:hypothetical protein
MTTNFRESTQYKNWFFSKEEELVQIRQGTLQTNAHLLTSELREKGVQKEIEVLTIEEELATIRKNIAILSALCERFQFHLHVEGTAMIYFKRFLLYHSVTIYDITELM